MDLVGVGVGEANDVPVVHDEGGVPHVGRSSRLRTVIPVQRDEADPRRAFLSAACKPAVHRPGRVVFDGRVILAALEAASLRASGTHGRQPRPPVSFTAKSNIGDEMSRRRRQVATCPHDATEATGPLPAFAWLPIAQFRHRTAGLDVSPIHDTFDRHFAVNNFGLAIEDDQPDRLRRICHLRQLPCIISVR